MALIQPTERHVTWPLIKATPKRTLGDRIVETVLDPYNWLIATILGGAVAYVAVLFGILFGVI